MNEEIERRFRVEDPREAVAKARGSDPIEQGYLAVEPDGVQVRVRRKGDQRFLTVKRGRGERRDEVEIEIARADFEGLWQLTENRRIEKRRHYVESDELLFEVDVFEGELAGLSIVEVEFGSSDEARSFDSPAWFGEELTGDDRFSNVSLATDGLPQGES